MDPVAQQYEAYPYPERDPADEATRLVVGSPSNPVELDHFCFGGRRDWARPFEALVAGGGTGDALVMLAQRLADAKVPHRLTYLDMATASRHVAEARIAARGLDGVRFVTGDLLEAAALGPFDYIDCCGVLHHLPAPQAGFDALAAALKPGGGLGAMVYAPLGRTGVYPMQAALATLTSGLDPAQKVARARAVIDALPPTNWLRRNDLIGDHRRSDAGLYDLLLHARDTPFTADAVIEAAQGAGLRFAGFLQPARYDPATWLGDAPAPDLDPAQAAALAETLCGAIRAHVFYATRDGAGMAKPTPQHRPRLQGMAAAQLAKTAGRAVLLTIDGVKHRVALPRDAGPMLAMLDGRRPLGAVAQALGLDWIGFMARHGAVLRRLSGFGALLYSDRFA